MLHTRYRHLQKIHNLQHDYSRMMYIQCKQRMGARTASQFHRPFLPFFLLLSKLSRLALAEFFFCVFGVSPTFLERCGCGMWFSSICDRRFARSMDRHFFTPFLTGSFSCCWLAGWHLHWLDEMGLLAFFLFFIVLVMQYSLLLFLSPRCVLWR